MHDASKNSYWPHGHYYMENGTPQGCLRCLLAEKIDNFISSLIVDQSWCMMHQKTCIDPPVITISKIIDSTYQERMKYLFKGQKNWIPCRMKAVFTAKVLGWICSPLIYSAYPRAWHRIGLNISIHISWLYHMNIKPFMAYIHAEYVSRIFYRIWISYVVKYSVSCLLWNILLHRIFIFYWIFLKHILHVYPP